MRTVLMDGMKAAMKSGEKRKLATLRLINAAIKDRDIHARGVGKERVSDDDILAILAKMIKQREESAKIYEEGNRLELAAQGREAMEIIMTSSTSVAVVDDEGRFGGVVTLERIRAALTLGVPERVA